MFPDDGPYARSGYSKHLEFFRAGKRFKERLMQAGNRIGKTEAGAYEATCHLTGIYPHWWEGAVFKEPTNLLAAGESGKVVRDVMQEKLMGVPSDWGTGMIPKHLILEQRTRAGVADALDIVRVKHITGGTSTLQFQSYDQGREAFQGSARHVVWNDEEPPLAIYSEGYMRTMTTHGIVMTTFTPMKGMSDTVMSLMKKALDGLISITTATWDDAPHLDEQDKKIMMAGLMPHQRDARSRGIPSMGSGAIYPVNEADIVCDPFIIPKHWKHVYGLDVGWNFTAAVFGAYDPDADILYITSDYKRSHAEPSIHAAAIKARAKGDRKPGVIDPASKGRSQADGESLLAMYRQLGLNLQSADNAVETGLFAVWERLSLGKMKVFKTCQGWLEEFRVYRRDEKGRVVKQDDHEMDATRYLVISGINISRSEVPGKKKSLNGFFGGTWASN